MGGAVRCGQCEQTFVAGDPTVDYHAEAVALGSRQAHKAGTMMVLSGATLGLLVLVFGVVYLLRFADIQWGDHVLFGIAMGSTLMFGVLSGLQIAGGKALQRVQHRPLVLMATIIAGLLSTFLLLWTVASCWVTMVVHTQEPPMALCISFLGGALVGVLNLFAATMSSRALSNQQVRLAFEERRFPPLDDRS